MAYLLKSALTVLLACHAVQSLGTTENLESIFKGRCLDYKTTRSVGLTITNVNCTDLWIKFSNAWAFKDSCGQNVGNYDGVFDSLSQTLPRNKALFWSGTMDFAHRLSNDGVHYVTLEDSLIGYIANGLTWCGQGASPGINYTSCPPYGSCPTEAVNNFWLAASKWFASHAEGEVQVVLNGSNPTRRAYRKESIFASLEIINMKSDKVTKVTAFVVHDLDKPRVEPCGTLSLLDLQSDVLSKNIGFACVDNPPEVKYLLCADSPDSIECSQTTVICDDSASAGAGMVSTDRTIAGTVAAMATSLIVFLVSI